MLDLKNATIAQLEAELKKRNSKTPPKRKVSLDLTDLITTCDEYLNALAKTGYADEDFVHYIFEEAMKALYGDDVFDWVNTVEK